MLALDYMTSITEESKMWEIKKKLNYEIWTSKICTLKIIYFKDKCKIYIDYKGYNVILPMGMWGFENEIQDRKIKYEVEGEKGDFKTLCYVVELKELKLFCDMIFFFLSEHNLTAALSETLKY